jgi:DNA polymerase I-like protein with 3'-5' exonuclease and polymerase domains
MNYPDLNRYDRFAIDTETTGLKYLVDRPFGISISLPGGGDFYWDLREYPRTVEWLNDQMKGGYAGKIIAHNASFDYRMLHYINAAIPLNQMDDTVIRACCIDEHLFSYELDNLAKIYLGRRKESDIYEALAEIFGGRATRNVQIGNLHAAPSDLVAPYAKTDTRLTLDLWDWQEREIERQELQDITKFERDLMPTFIRAEMRGIRVDLNYTEEAADKLTPVIDEKQRELNDLVGLDVNVNSSPQVKSIFSPEELEDGTWITDSGHEIGTTPKGGPSLKAEYLRGMDDPRAALILEIRSIIKTRDTFLLGHVMEHSVNGRVYPNINQSKGEDGGTGTGRLSYTNPAMQQIPSRNKKVAAIAKPCFLPDEGMVWVDADESSFEVRVFAHLVNNPEIIKAYQDNPDLDFHQYVADITKLVRNATYSGQPNAKQLNLSMIFNSGNGAIADKMGMPWEWETFLPKGKLDNPDNYVTYKKAGPEAMKVINKYHNRIPGIKKLAEKAEKTAKSRGYLRTFTGRHLRFPNGWKTYKASGILIQATSAELNKENWKMIEEELDGEGHLILNTHDSYSMCLPENWKPYYEAVESRLNNRPYIRVPLRLELSGAGKDWWSALNG